MTENNALQNAAYDQNEIVNSLVASSTTSTSINTNIKYTDLYRSLDGKKIRVCSEDPSITYTCRYIHPKLMIGDQKLSDFTKIRRIKSTYKQDIEVQLPSGDWVSILLFEANRDNIVFAKNIQTALSNLASLNITTIKQFHESFEFQYRIEQDVLTSVAIPLLRVCNESPAGDCLKSSVLPEDCDIVHYIDRMCTHVAVGSRTTSIPFLSASKNIEVIKYYSVAFLRPVISIFQEKVSYKAFHFGGWAGRRLFTSANTFQETRYQPSRYFAEASDEVLIANSILADEYSHVKAGYTKIVEWKCCNNSFSPPSLEVLKQDFNQILLRKDGGGVIKLTTKLTSPGNPATSYVVKVGCNKGFGASNHICNEFIANVLYKAMNVPVPNCVLRSVNVKVTAKASDGTVLDISSFNAFVLIREYIVGKKPNLDSQDDVNAIANHALADIILANFDILGDNKLENLIIKDGLGYRIDAGAALFCMHDGTQKKDFNIGCRKVQDLANDLNQYFSKKNRECNDVLKKINSRFLERSIHSITSGGTFWSVIQDFTKHRYQLNLWETALELVKSRIQTLYYTNMKEIWQLSSLERIDEDEEAKKTTKDYDIEEEEIDRRAATESTATATDGTCHPTYSIQIFRKRGKKSKALLEAEKNGAEIIDLTSKAEDKHFAKLSPFHPFKNMAGAPAFEVPFMPQHRSYSVEGIWQGLKVFKNETVDVKMFSCEDVRKIRKRPVNAKRGQIVGHYGKDGQTLGYVDARRQIYVPVYNQMLKEYCNREIEDLYKILIEKKKIIFLDYFTNEDVENLDKPLSHASLVKKQLNDMLFERQHVHIV